MSKKQLRIFVLATAAVVAAITLRSVMPSPQSDPRPIVAESCEVGSCEIIDTGSSNEMREPSLSEVAPPQDSPAPPPSGKPRPVAEVDRDRDLDLDLHGTPRAPERRDPSFRRAEAELKVPEMMSAPLPKDSLYIRRAAAYGTKLSTGVREEIEQGALVDQVDIRFDDFADNTFTGLAEPIPGQGIAVSTGLAKIPGSLRRGSRSTHYLELAIRAGVAGESSVQTERVPINYVFAVDVSSSMCADDKLVGAKAAIIAAYRELRPEDSLGIVTFNESVSTVLASHRVSDLPPAVLTERLGAVICGGGTDINLGLSFAFDEIGRVRGDRSANRVVLFSDGQPTSGEQDWVSIRRNATGHAREHVAIYTFGFGPDANLHELDALAGGTGGEHAYVTDAGAAGALLRQGVARRSSLAALNLQVRLDLVKQVRVWNFFGHAPVGDPLTERRIHHELAGARTKVRAAGGRVNAQLIDGETGIRVGVPDLALGETYWLVLEIEADRGRVGKAAVSFYDAIAAEPRELSLDLDVSGVIAAAVVHEHALSLRTSEVVFQALDDLHEQRTEQATARLKGYAEFLGMAGEILGSHKLRDDAVAVRKLVSLTQNLGKELVRGDDASARAMILALSEFGRINNGHIRLH